MHRSHLGRESLDMENQEEQDDICLHCLDGGGGSTSGMLQHIHGGAKPEQGHLRRCGCWSDKVVVRLSHSPVGAETCKDGEEEHRFAWLHRVAFF